MGWYVVHTQARAEERAEFNLERQGYSVYLPRFLKIRSHARRRDWVVRPMFPRYLFVEMDVERFPWRKINSTFGVSHLITLHNSPIAVPPSVIDEIMGREDERGLVKPPPPTFRRGDKVKIEAGAFAAQSGIFECMSDTERVTILLSFLGRHVKARVPLSQVTGIA